MQIRRLLLTALLGLVSVGCIGPFATDGERNDEVVPLTPTRLKYRLDTRYAIFYCDPDLWPLVRGDEPELAVQRFPAIAADTERLKAIVEHLQLTDDGDFTPGEKLQIYREDKRLASITLEPVGSAYSFRLRAAEPPDQETDVVAIRGEIDGEGSIVVRERAATIGTCPICLPGDAYIATAGGPVRVRELEPGSLVYSLDDAHQRVLTRVLRTVRVPAPVDHEFIRVRLADGRALQASPGHPTSDGRIMRYIAVGDVLDGSKVVEVTRTRLEGDPGTYDLLPASTTGVYWANAVLIGSTLSAAPARPR